MVVVERRGGAIDKACGEGLMPHTLRQLECLGVEPKGKDFFGITYVDDQRRVGAEFRSGVGRGYVGSVCTQHFWMRCRRQG
ncbi:MAG: hypothetical protein QOD39_5076 [Mycobacterium sp.]|nr:hypothetical protein [Mycobacterium sp.]